MHDAIQNTHVLCVLTGLTQSLVAGITQSVTDVFTVLCRPTK
jgi:hypothetical protein